MLNAATNIQGLVGQMMWLNAFNVALSTTANIRKTIKRRSCNNRPRATNSWPSGPMLCWFTFTL